MKILVVGGGSGGHVTPALAVIAAIKSERPRADIRFWCDFSFAEQASSLIHAQSLNIPITRIRSGKLRRYHGVSVARQLLDIPTTLKNIRDSILVIIGFLQSLALLVWWWPDAIFTKGGFVCLPVGLAARLLHIPLVIHDSDAHPGLTNRVLSRYATYILTGSPLKYYPYPRNKSMYVGIPIAPEFHPFLPEQQAHAKRALGFDPTRPLIVVTGGGLGARRVNEAVLAIAPQLLEETQILHITGKGQYEAVKSVAVESQAYKIYGFISENVPDTLGAADIVIARAGATTMVELAALAKPTILIPNAQLTGNHQTKNAAVYDDAKAALVMDETEVAKRPERLLEAVQALLHGDRIRTTMAQNIQAFAKPDAAQEAAQVVLQAARRADHQ